MTLPVALYRTGGVASNEFPRVMMNVNNAIAKQLYFGCAKVCYRRYYSMVKQIDNAIKLKSFSEKKSY